MAELNLDAARAARLEASGEPHVVVFNDESYEAPHEAPWRFVEWLARGSFPNALKAAVGEDAWKALSASASKEDVHALVDWLIDVWGLRRNKDDDKDDASGG